MMASFTTKESSATDEDFSHLGIFVNVEVEALLIDPYGNKTGFDPSTNSYIWQIPGSGSWVDEIPGILSTTVIGVGHPAAGSYILQIVGTDQRIYGVSISLDDISGTTHSLGFIGLTASGLISPYTITYDPTPGITPKVERVVTIGDLKNDVNIAFNIGLIDNPGIKQSLLAKLDAAERAISRGQKQTAINQLNAFINEVNAQKDKHIKEDAAKILLEGANYLIGHL